MPIPLGILAVAGAGGAAGAYDLLQTTILGSNTANVTFSGLGAYSQYKHLQLRIVAKSTRTTSDDDAIFIRFNSDTGNNYAHHRLEGNGSSVTSRASSSSSFILSGFASASRVGNISRYGPFVIDILDFSNTNKNTTLRSLNGNEGDSQDIVMLGSGLWNNTSAITSILLYLEIGPNFTAGSRFSLYGVR